MCANSYMRPELIGLINPRHCLKMNKPERLNWINEFLPTVKFVQQTICAKPIVFWTVVLLGPISLFLDEGMQLFEFACEWIFASFLGGELIRIASRNKPFDEEPQIPAIRYAIEDFIYFLSSCILYILYYLPGLWWILISSLSSVLFLIGDMGLNGSFSRNRELIKGYFWESARYLLPVTLLIVLPSYLIPDGVETFLDNELECWSYTLPQMALLMAYLIANMISWSCWLASLSYLVRLVEFLELLKFQEAGAQLDSCKCG